MSLVNSLVNNLELNVTFCVFFGFFFLGPDVPPRKPTNPLAL